jgi:hypothetical protein
VLQRQAVLRSARRSMLASATGPVRASHKPKAQRTLPGTRREGRKSIGAERSIVVASVFDSTRTGSLRRVDRCFASMENGGSRCRRSACLPRLALAQSGRFFDPHPGVADLRLKRGVERDDPFADDCR